MKSPKSFILLLLLSFQSLGDDCNAWFKKSGIGSADKDCASKCSLLPTGMDTFSCPQQCIQFCKGATCSAAEHWVPPYHQREYRRGNGSLVKAAEVSGHCEKDSSDYKIWNPKLMDGRPLAWRNEKEQTTQWAPGERERVLEALSETPNFLKDRRINGIYRMKASAHQGNPASNNYSDFVLYDAAFDNDAVLTYILDHELAHRLFENLSEDEKTSFRHAGKWREERDRKGIFKPGRSEANFARPNDLLSPTEDFADSITLYIHKQTELQKIFPPIYDWMRKNFGSKLKAVSK